MHVTIVPTSQASGQMLLTIPPLHIPQMLLPAAPTPAPKASANGPLRPDPPSASADPDSKSKEPHSKVGNDPTLSAGQVDNALKGGNAGDNLDPTPTSKQVGNSDPANQHENSQNIPPTCISPEGPNNSPAAGGSGDDNNGAAPGLGLNVVLQDSSYSPKSSEGTIGSPLPYKSVVLASPTAFVVGGSSIVKAANGGVIIGTSTYPPGSQAQISDNLFSVGISSIVVNGTSYAIPAPSSVDKFLLDTSPISRASDGGAIFEGGTIGLGSRSSINGPVISVGASTVVLDGTSYALPSSAGAILQCPSPQPKASVTLTNGAVLTPGGIAATISGTTYAIPSDNSGLVVSGQIVSPPTETALQSVFTVVGQTFTAASTGFAIGGQNVALDGIAVTFDGTLVSLRLSGVQLGSKTIPLASAQATEKSLGGLIMRGFGSGAEPGATARGGNESEVLAFTGDSSRVGRTLGIVAFEAMIMVMGFVELRV